MLNQKVIISKNNRSIIKKCILVISLLLIVLGMVLFIMNIINNNCIKQIDNDSLKAFFSRNKIENKNIISSKKENKDNIIRYMAVLEIPSINLMQGIPYLGKDNTVDRNIQIIEPISLPDMVDGNFILASHSGSSPISYFKNLNKLKNNELVYVYYDNVKYTYIVNNQYLVDKGRVTIKRNHSKRTLTLITCDKKDNSKQLVVIAYLQNQEKY